MAHGVPIIALLVLFCTSTLSRAQPADLPVSEVAPGIFLHRGETALMTRQNNGATANIGFVIGESAVAVIDTGGSVHEGELLLAAIRARTDRPIVASGGISNLDDIAALRALVPLGVEGAIVGKALYAKAFTLAEAISAASD